MPEHLFIYFLEQMDEIGSVISPILERGSRGTDEGVACSRPHVEVCGGDHD